MLSGVSVRSLHYYDGIGLLKPSFVRENGYRFYDEKELLRLQQILFFKELDFSLEDIKEIINSSDFKTIEALKDQKKMLEAKNKRVKSLIKTIGQTINKLKGGVTMNNDDLFASFADKELIENMKETILS